MHRLVQEVTRQIFRDGEERFLKALFTIFSEINDPRSFLCFEICYFLEEGLNYTKWKNVIEFYVFRKFVRYTVGEGGRIVVNKMRSSPRHYVARHDPNEIFTEQSEDAMDTMKNLQRCLNMMLGVVSEIGEDSADHSAIQIAGAVVRLSAISLLHVAKY